MSGSTSLTGRKSSDGLKFDKRAWAARFVRMQGFGCQPGANTKLVARLLNKSSTLTIVFFMLVESHK